MSLAILIVVAALIALAFLVTIFRDKSAHLPGCDCRPCQELHYRSVYAELAQEERQRRGSEL